MNRAIGQSLSAEVMAKERHKRETSTTSGCPAANNGCIYDDEVVNLLLQLVLIAFRWTHCDFRWKVLIAPTSVTRPVVLLELTIAQPWWAIHPNAFAASLPGSMCPELVSQTFI